MILSIIIPVFNSEKFIERCVKSLMRQNLDNDNFEILLIDDGSKDDSYAICKKMADLHDNVKAYHKENGGTGDTRNFGFDKFSGKYVYFLDVDDYLAYNTLAILIDCLEKNKLEILCFQSLKTTSTDLTESQTPLEHKKVEVMDGIEYIAKNGFQFEVWRYIINTEFLFKTNLRYESERLLEDSYFTVRLFIASKRIAMIPLDVHRYVQEPTSALHRPDKVQGQRILNDLEILAGQYDSLIKKYESLDHPYKDPFIRELEAKKQFFVYYSVVRSYSGDVEFENVWQMLQRMKKIKAYPFNKIADESDSLANKLQFIFNRRPLLYIFFKGVRPLSSFKNKFKGRKN